MFLTAENQVLLPVSLKALDVLLEAVEELVLDLLVWPQGLLHVEAVLEGALDDVDGVLVVLVDAYLLVDEVVGLPLLRGELRGEGQRGDHD